MESQRARRAAGWRWVKVLVPYHVHARVGQIVSKYRLSREAVTLHALTLGLLVDRLEWQKLSRAEPIRMRRRDAGRGGISRQRRREKREKGQPPS